MSKFKVRRRVQIDATPESSHVKCIETGEYALHASLVVCLTWNPTFIIYSMRLAIVL
jgi:hypothetical protein